MKFVLVRNQKILEDVLVDRCLQLTRNNKKLGILIPGGSNIRVAINVLHRLDNDTLQRLDVALSDERFGEVGHKDSNYQQYVEAGLEPQTVHLKPILNNTTIEETTSSYEAALGALFADNDSVLAFLGMGEDGHISGILPGSPAISSMQLAEHYDGGSYSRITTTITAIAKCNEVIVGTFGESKKAALLKLAAKTVPAEKEPAQYLRNMDNVTIINDQIGDTQ